jgi:hypothetical protein
VGARLARGQAGGQGTPPLAVRKAKTTTLFKSPEGYPNAIAVSPEGLWIGEQKTDNACLVDWNGKLLKTVKTESKNTSGMAVGGGYIWMGANAAPNGIFQTDMSSKTISHRQVPLGGGGCHGVEYVNGKLWIAALRLRGILRTKPSQKVEHVIGGQMRALARQSDRQAQFKEAQTLGSGHAPQLFRRFAVKRRFRIDENVQQTWLIHFVDRVKSQLHPVGQELFKRRVDGVVDPAQTSDRLAFTGGFQRQTRRTVRAHGGFTLH